MNGYKPANYSATEKVDGQFPLLIFLHGAGERGKDNAKQLKWGREFMLAAAKDHDAFVLVPQCPNGKRWMEVHWGEDKIELPEQPSEPMALLLALLPQLQVEFPIDEKRLYVMGLSMGGQGTWDMIQRNPGMFAAAAPVCGGGDRSKAELVKDLPIWIFHGGKDGVVPTDLSRKMMARMKEIDGKAKYTEYPGVGHNSWTPAMKEADLAEWLFSQRRQ